MAWKLEEIGKNADLDFVNFSDTWEIIEWSRDKMQP